MRKYFETLVVQDMPDFDAKLLREYILAEVKSPKFYSKIKISKQISRKLCRRNTNTIILQKWE